MSRAAEPVRPEAAAERNASSPAASSPRRLCPFCGTINESDAGGGGGAAAGPCTRCGMDDTPATRQATRVRIGPWYVLQSRNPAAPGMKFSTLLQLVRKGQVTQRSIVRGPTTSQFWTVAARVKGLSREFGVCYQCGGEVEPTANLCPHCQKLQEPPINPDVLLEGSSSEGSTSSSASASASSAGAAVARRPRTPNPEPSAPPATRSTTAPPPMGGILTAKELATAFQLDFKPNPPGGSRPRKRHRIAKVLFVLIVLAAVASAVVAYLRPDLRDQSIEWVRRYSQEIKDQIEAQRRQAQPQGTQISTPPQARHQSSSPATDDGEAAGDDQQPNLDVLSDSFPRASLDALMAARPATIPPTPSTPPTAHATSAAAPEASDRAQGAAAMQRPAADAPKIGDAGAKSSDLSEDEIDNAVRSLWRAAIDAEAEGNYAKAVRNYEQIQQMPRAHWPGGLDVRLRQAKQSAQ